MAVAWSERRTAWAYALGWSVIQGRGALAVRERPLCANAGDGVGVYGRDGVWT